MDTNLRQRISNLTPDKQRLLADRLHSLSPNSERKADQNVSRLRAFVKRKISNEPLELDDIRAFISNSLPAHSIPATIEFIDSYPLTPNGKIDRAALSYGQRYIPIAPDLAGKAASSDATERLSQIWKRVLGVETLSNADNFFEAGGDSISALRLVSESRQEGFEFSVSELFKNPTVSQLARIASPDDSQPNREQAIVELWRKALQNNSITANTNFFEAGGDSISAISVVSQLRESGYDVSVSQLFKHPSPAQLASKIDGGTSEYDFRALLTLQSQGDGAPVFCVHGYTGDVFGFVELANSLRAVRPVFGLQATGLDDKSPRQTTFEEMAALYASEIMKKQPAGPYHLIGQSLGGWIAYAVAQEIHRRGGIVGSLGILDTQASTQVPWVFKLPYIISKIWARSGTHLKAILTMPFSQKWAYAKGRLKWLWFHVRGEMTDSVLTEEFNENSERPSDYYYFAKVGDRYQPPKWQGDADLFICAEFQRRYALFWNYLVKGTLRRHLVPGDHHSMLDAKHAPDFAAIYDRVLGESEKRIQKAESNTQKLGSQSG